MHDLRHPTPVPIKQAAEAHPAAASQSSKPLCNARCLELNALSAATLVAILLALWRFGVIKARLFLLTIPIALRSHTSAALIAASLSLAFMASNDYWSKLFFFHWLTLALGILYAEKQWPGRYAATGSVVIVASLFVAALISLLDSRILGMYNFGQAIWLAPFSLLLFIKLPERIFSWMLPFGLAHAGVLLYEAIIMKVSRPDGLTDSPNPAAGLLALLAAYCLSTRHKWLALPMILALVATGSRLAALTLLVVVLIMLARRVLNPRPVVLAGAGLALLLIPVYPYIHDNYARPETLAEGLSLRLSLERLSFVPQGYIPEGEGPPHNVPLRIALEAGIPAALAWVGLTGWALWRKPRWDAAWWMLLGVALLGMLDYYVWISGMAGFWWLLLGMRFNPLRLASP